MKRKSFNKDILRSILKSKSRFIAIVAIVALGAGFFSGLGAISYDMKLTGDSYYDRTNMMDIHLLSPYGFTEDDIDAIKSADGIEDVMTGYSTDAVSTLDGKDMVVRIHSLPSDMSEDNADWLNRPTLTEGRLPEESGECVLSAALTGMGDVALGDTIVLGNEDGSLDDAISTTKFKVVGFADSSYYIAITYGTSNIGSGTIERFMYIPESDFCTEVYTDVFATVTDAQALNCFESDYEILIDKTVENLEDVSAVRAPIRFDEVKSDAMSAIEDAEDEYEEAKQKAEVSLSDALATLEDAEDEIADSEKLLDDSQKKINSGWDQYNAGMSAYNDGLAQYNAQLGDYNTAKQQYDAVASQLESGYAQYEALIASGTDPAALAEMKAQLDGTKAVLDAQKPQLDAYKAALDGAKATLDTTKQQLDDAKTELVVSQEKIDDGRKELEDAKIELADGWHEYDEAKLEAEQKLADAKDEIEDAKKEVDELEMSEWYVLDRETNIGYVSFEGDANRMASLATVFPVMFFLVAALVALTTMTRMVDEERMTIGTYKALGYSNARIMSKYLLYAFAASVLGSVIGIAILMKVLPAVVWAAYGILYKAPPIQMPYNPTLVISGIAAATACTMLSTYFACRSALKEQPSALMRPRAPKAGKRILLERIGFIWKRLKFSYKVTFRNIFRYKKRLFMTLAGISGCTALLLTGFGVKDSVSDIVHCQFDELYKYNTMIAIDEDVPEDAETILNDDSIFSGWTVTSQKSTEFSNDNGLLSGYIFIPSDAKTIPDFIEFVNMDSGEAVEFDEHSVVLTQKASDTLGIGVGDSISVEVEDGRYCDFTVTGVTEHYVYHYLYIAPEVWRDTAKLEPQYNQVLAQCIAEGERKDAAADDLLDCEGIGTVQFTDSISKSFDDMIASLNYVVLVLIVCAGALAFVVLYNLTNINITERKRELATIKVLGFYNSEVSAYIYRETAILTVIGCALGLALGIVMHAFVTKTVEVDAVMFGRGIEPLSFVWAAAMTIVFSVIVNLVMHKRLKSIDMVESLKSAE